MELIDRHTDGVLLGAQGVFYFHVIFFGAEDDAQGWIVAIAPFLVIQQIQIKIHLAGEFRFERAHLEVEGDQSLEEAVVEEQVDEVFFLPYREPVLTADKTKTVAEFEQERLQPGDQPVLQFPFFHFPAEAKEFQVVGALEHLGSLLGPIFRQGEREIVRLLIRHRPFVRASLDLVEEHITRPAKLSRGAEVPEPGGGGGQLLDDHDVMTPGNFCNKLLQKLDRVITASLFGPSVQPD